MNRTLPGLLLLAPMTPRNPAITLALRIALALALLAASMILGTATHEILGHGLVGLLVGGKIDGIEILGMEFRPAPKWLGYQGHYGMCYVSGVPTERGEHWMALAGSLSTTLVAIAATIALLARRWSRPTTNILLTLALWWIDLLTYTLPTWGLRRSIFWGGTYSEPYEAAVALGLPGWAFQSLVLLTSALLAATWCLHIRQLRSRSS